MAKLTLLYRGIVFGLILVVAGCVSKSTFEQSQKSLEETQAKYNDEKAQSTKLSSERDSLKAQLEDSEQKLMLAAKDRGQLKTSLEEMKQAMEEMRARQAEERKQLAEFKDLSNRLKKLTDSGALTVKLVDGKMVVSLGSDILFASGSAKLSAGGLEALKEVTQQLAAITGKKYQIEGHTDNVPIATSVFPSNWELASARALTVVKYMIEQGMQAERVSAASYGEYQPTQPNETVEGKAANRRIAIVVVPDLSALN